MPNDSQTPRRRVLIVAYFYPPMNIVGARRPHALAKWLRRAGHSVAVVTSEQSGRGADDASDRLVRARDLLATRLNWRRHNLHAATGQADADWSPGSNFWGDVFVPDVQLYSWAPFALGSALRLRRQFRPDVVITTSPTESAHAVGWALRRLGTPWVADLRDGWRFEAPRVDYRLAFQRRIDTTLEALVARSADRVVTVTRPLAADLRRRTGVDVEVVTNGFDPDDAPPPDAVAAAPLTPGKVSLVHTGGLGGERTLAPLLEALANMSRDDARLAERVEIVLAGSRTAAERELYDRAEFRPFVRHLGFVERDAALALQRAADWLVVVTSGKRTGEATGKLFEYLASGRPILAVGAGSAAGDIVEGAQRGIVIPTHDPVAAEAALRRILAGERPASVNGGDAFLYPALAARYEEILEQAIAAARR